ncbi:ABC transporter substrate-binding protein [Thalassobacillus sp. C254]|uniref:ABC transporter substrate-binding protein n=1 Tax=Thalassobacillus sp. C254 TaxID=1225341 RepID=UPI0022B63614|nr:ABC transporter substrate-binding protein [Thalassobacillus sp. C254]
MKKYCLLPLAFLIFMSGCAANEGEDLQQGHGKEPDDKSITLMFSFGSETLDPHLDWVPVRAGITETLVKINEDLELEPWLAESWEQVDDNTWEFKIKEDITFHDGAQLDAQAAADSLERAFEVNPSIEAALHIEEVEATDQTLVIHTTQPNPMLVSELVNPNTAITQVQTEEDIKTRPVGTGPFKVNDFEPNNSVHLIRFHEYWDGKAKVEEAYFTFNEDNNVRGMSLQTNEADIAYHLSPESLDPIEQDENLSVHSVPSMRTHFLMYQFNNPLLQDQTVREALDLLIDRESAANDIMTGHADTASSPFHPSYSFGVYNETVHSLNDAESLLQDDGWQQNEEGILEKEGQVLDFTLITYGGRPELPLIAQILQGEASKIGINIEIQMVENVDAT